MEEQSGCKLSNTSHPDSTCTASSRRAEGPRDQQQAQDAAAWRLLEASQAEPMSCSGAEA